MSNKIMSPILPDQQARKVSSLDRKSIVEAYRDLLRFDVSPFLPEELFTSETGVYKCDHSGYKFIHPASLAGKGNFYDALTKVRAYHQGGRWEWNIVISTIKPGESVFEVGAGGLTFMEMLKKKGVDVEGLEINPSSVEKAAKVGLKVYPLMIEEFSKDHENTFDMVCSFHVLEHVADVKSFIEACCSILKPGGRLVLSVPNNDSYLKLDKYLAANLPPHHMGYWNEASLRSLTEFFPLSLSEVRTQTYNSDHSLAYYQCWYRGMGQTLGIVGKILGKLARPVFDKYISAPKDKLIGPDILVIFNKI